MRPLSSPASWVAALISCVVLAVCVRFNTFAAFDTDPAGYVSAAHRWARGELFAPAPLQLWAPWAGGGKVEAPLSYRPGPGLQPANDVSWYPLGLPVVMAAGLVIGGEWAPYLIPPLFAGLLCWCAYLIGRQAGGPWAGVVAAVWIGVSPITLAHSMMPMSDVPATALWMLAWVMSLRRSRTAASAAGCAVALAVMMRPNLAPLAVVPGALVLAADAGGRAWRAWEWRRAALFAACAAIGPGLVLWAQAVLYGGPLNPGYPDWEGYFSTTRIPVNFSSYLRQITAVHSPLVFAGLAAIPLLLSNAPRSSLDRRAATIAVSAAALMLINLALYLPYMTNTALNYLRFLLPGLTALFVLCAAVLIRLARALRVRSPLLVPLALVPVIVIAGYNPSFTRERFRAARDEQRAAVMGKYLREALPPNAAVLSFLQSGVIAHYTGRTIVRIDLLEPAALDRVLGDLVRHRYRPVFVIDEGVESREFKRRFAGSLYQNLDWPPRAEFLHPGAIWYLDPADREPYRQRQRWAIDRVVLLTPRAAPSTDPASRRGARAASRPAPPP